MFAKVHLPEILKPEELDLYLEGGWFRMGPTIFTTNFLSFKENYYSAIWLRIVLNKFTDNKTQQNLKKRNVLFRTEITKASITAAKEELYLKYKQVISFDASPSLHQLLYRNDYKTIFDTYEVNVYHGEQLIATGFFDKGERSAAGIVSIYDPMYKKHSLGKYLIYLKINYCRELGLDYFYPGYFVPGYSFFDYKLDIGKLALEYLQFSSRQWLPINTFDAATTPLSVMLTRLHDLQQRLDQRKIQSRIVKYAYFDANLIPELRDADMFDFPVFLFFDDLSDNDFYLIVFDIKDHRYHLVKCDSLWTSPSDSEHSDVYSKHLLKMQHELFSEEDPARMALKLSVKNEAGK